MLGDGPGNGGAGPWDGARRRYGGDAALRRAVPADVAALAAMLVRAFDDDPVACYLFGRTGPRRRGLRSFFDLQLRRLVGGAGDVWTTDARNGAALWVPPSDTVRAGWRDLLRLTTVAVDLVAGGRPGAALRLLAEVERVRPTTPHWYLATIGTDPPAQGTGVGTALLDVVLRTVDAQGHAAYLESSKERNLAFYARHRFAVVRTVRSVDGRATLWCMWRPPRGSG